LLVPGLADVPGGPADGLHRSLHIALDEERNLLAAGLLQLLHHLLKRARRAGRAQRLPALAQAIVGELARAALALDDGEGIAGLGCRIKAQDLRRHRWPGLRDRLAAVVDERAHTAPGRTGDDNVADIEGAALHEHGANRPASALELGLDDNALRRTLRVGAQVQQLRLQVDGFEKLVEAGPLESRHLDLQRFARHAFNDD